MVAHEESTVRAASRPDSSVPSKAGMRRRFRLDIKAIIRNIDRTALLACGLLAVLLALRCALAAGLPLAFDEAYYWLWSKHLALGYYEHPADIALAIRAGTFLFGDTQWGVRAVPVILSVVASAAVWRNAALLLSSEKMGAIACLLFNSTLMISAETMGATPDSLLVAAAALLLWAIAELETSGDRRWWLAAGAAAGLAISAKYTGFFLCGSLVLWLAANSHVRTWLRTPWPYAGALIAVLFFVPTLYWNATHGFVSFAFQFRRVGDAGAGHVFEFAIGQIALASPFVIVLAGFGLARNWRIWRGRPTLAFAAATVLPAFLFFVLDAFHDRVQGNWPCFAYPAVVLLAAQSFAKAARSGPVERLSRAWALPVALLILFLVDVQASFGILPLGMRDPIARMTAIGFAPVAAQVDAEAAGLKARAIVTTNYAMTSWLSFYAHAPVDIVQVEDEKRFLSSPPAGREELAGNLLYVTARPDKELPGIHERFSQVSPLARLERSRNGHPISAIYLYRISGFRGGAAGRVPWAGRGKELQAN